MRRAPMLIIVTIFLITASLFIDSVSAEPKDAVDITGLAGVTPDKPTYSLDLFFDKLRLMFGGSEKKAEKAIDTSEEKLAEARLMVQQGKKEEAEQALLGARETNELVVEGVSPDLGEDASVHTEFSMEQLQKMKEELPEGWEDIGIEIDRQLSQQERVKLASQIAEKRGDYCDKLAREDWKLMEKDPKCDPEQAPDWLKEFIEKDIANRQKAAEKEMVDQMTTCIMDPRKCECERVPVKSEAQRCEKNKALAIRCEFEEDMSACDELKGMDATPPDMPDFLKPVFERNMADLMKKKEAQMFDRFAPPECKAAGVRTREECEKIMMEKYGAPPPECVKDGRFIGEEECNAIMIELHEIPDECIRDGKPIPEEECLEIMTPPECKEAGAYSREECEKIMRERYVPPECEEAGAFSEEECRAVMEKIGEERRENETMLFGDEGMERIPKEELRELINDSLIEEPIERPPEADELGEEIDELERQKGELEDHEEELEEQKREFEEREEMEEIPEREEAPEAEEPEEGGGEGGGEAGGEEGGGNGGEEGGEG